MRRIDTIGEMLVEQRKTIDKLIEILTEETIEDHAKDLSTKDDEEEIKRTNISHKKVEE